MKMDSHCLSEEMVSEELRLRNEKKKKAQKKKSGEVEIVILYKQCI